MFSVGFSSGLAGGRCRRLMFDGTCSLRVVCRPALSSVSTAWAPADAPADLIEVMLHGTGIGARKHHQHEFREGIAERLARSHGWTVLSRETMASSGRIVLRL